MTKWTLKKEGSMFVLRDLYGKALVQENVQGEAFKMGMALAYVLRVSVTIICQDKPLEAV